MHNVHRDTVAATLLALGAAASFAVANVAQMRAARRVDAPHGLSAVLLLRLLRDRDWLTGSGASVAGYGMQAVALFLAPVLLVQPLIVTELVFALPLAASLAGTRLHRREWSGAVLVAAGVVIFVVIGHPRGNHTDLSDVRWLIIILGIACLVGLLMSAAEIPGRGAMARATLLATAASLCFGLLAILTKVVGHQFRDRGIAALLLAQPWLLAVVAIAGLLFAQTAFRIAPLSVSLPVIDVGEPLVASLLAALAFGETIAFNTGAVVGVVLSAAAITTGIALLDTSPLVRAAQATLTSATPRYGNAIAAVHECG